MLELVTESAERLCSFSKSNRIYTKVIVMTIILPIKLARPKAELNIMH